MLLSFSMLLFGRGKKKLEEKAVAKPSPTTERLKAICEELGKPELIGAMNNFLYLEPNKIRVPLESFLSDAQEYETKGNILLAEVGYRIAGMLSLQRESTSDSYLNPNFAFASHFKAAQRLATDPKKYETLLSDPKGSFEIARRYYTELRKKEEETEEKKN